MSDGPDSTAIVPTSPIVTLKKSLTRKTLEFLIQGASPDDADRSLHNAVIEIKACGYNLYETFQLLSEKEIKGIGPITGDNMKIVNNAFYGKALVTKIKSDSKGEGSKLDNRLEEVLHGLTGKVLIYCDREHSETYLWQKTPTIVERLSLKGLQSKVAEVVYETEVMGSKSTKELADTFLMYPVSNPLRIYKMPPAFSLDPNEVTFRYLDLPLDADMPTPTWDAFIKYCGANGPALMAYTWSIFQPVELRQYLLLSSQGETGKGSYTSWLLELMGEEATCSLSSGDANWPALCIGKRLGLWPELNQTSFVQSSQFKAITGHDHINVTQKYEKSFTAKIDIRFILSTNGTIDIEGKTSESSRCILVDMQQVPKSDFIDDYKAKLKAETAGFLYKCKIAFEALYSNNKIKVDQTDFEMHASFFEDEYRVVFLKAFKYEEGSTLLATTFRNAIQATSNKHDKFFIAHFKKWMEREYPNIKVKKNVDRYFTNLALSDMMQDSPLVINMPAKK